MSVPALIIDDGSYRAFEVKVLRFAHEIRWRIEERIHAKLRSRVSADDIMQEVFTDTFRAYPNVPTDDIELKRWMTKVGKVRLTDAIRFHTRARRHIDRVKQLGTTSYIELVHSIPSSLPSPSSVDAAREVVQSLYDALDSLPERYRVAIELHYLKGSNVAHVADRLEISTEAARALLRRGMTCLRAALRRRGAGTFDDTRTS